MIMIEELKRKIVHAIASAPDVEAALIAYGLAWSTIKEYKFAFGAAKGGVPGFAVNRSFSGGAVVRGIFPDERVVVFDPETIKEMRSGTARYPVDYSISLDTNAFSYLKPFVLGKTGRLPSDFVEVFEFIARDDVRVDGMPYMLENLGGTNLQDEKKANHVFESIKAYEVLRTIDSAWLGQHGEVRSTLDDEALIKKAQEAMARLYRDLDDPGYMRGLRQRVDYLYVSLLKLASIQLQHKTWSTDRKVEAYIEFCHSRLATINAREMKVGREYFDRGQDLKFFGKIQAGRSDLLALLKNMAWDLFHVRQLESGMTMLPDPKARYFFPALLTYDQDLIEIIDLYPLKSIAFTSNESDILPVYHGDELAVIASDSAQIEILKTRYFSEIAAADRTARRDSMWTTLPGLITELEGQLSAFSV